MSCRHVYTGKCVCERERERDQLQLKLLFPVLNSYLSLQTWEGSDPVTVITFWLFNVRND